MKIVESWKTHTARLSEMKLSNYPHMLASAHMLAHCVLIGARQTKFIRKYAKLCETAAELRASQERR